MRKLVFVLLMLVNAGFLFSRNIETTENDTIPPKFNGSSDFNKFRDFFLKNLQFPSRSFENCEQGIAIISFQVSSYRTLDSIEFINELTPALNYEIVRCLMLSETLWTPASVNGKEISSTFTMPVTFKCDYSCTGVSYYIKQGNKSYTKSEFQNAFEMFKEVIRRDPYNIEILDKKIDCDRKLNKPDVLEKDLRLQKYYIKKKTK